MSTPLVIGLTDELVAELAREVSTWKHRDHIVITRLTLATLLAERAELLRDAGRFRLFASTVVAEFSGAELSSAQRSLFDAMNACDEISNIGEVEAMFDAAMQSEAKP
jgi:hypothetical protein